ncbi:hypothetical protein A9Q99_11915 [Gammaproteobacteria bacterium 45_16_T64]|nr:hypothetical protein A9Q99_11915 [Gammaproteobacteria bacterium 45_16_T64]
MCFPSVCTRGCGSISDHYWLRARTIFAVISFDIEGGILRERGAVALDQGAHVVLIWASRVQTPMNELLQGEARR